MNVWLFQGNPKLFEIDKYLKENKNITWSIRQKQYIDVIKKEDKVFIWRSDGGVKNSGGIVALCEITSQPYINQEVYSVDLNILELRLSIEEGMLLRSYLKEVPKTMNLPILRMTQNTNYKLDNEEAKIIFEYWNKPELLKNAAELPIIEKYLYSFKDEAEEWFKQCTFVNDYYKFFNEFKKRENLEMMEWEDVQKIGDNVNAFRMALAKKRALGHPNAPMEKYRSSFIYLVYGEDPIEIRIDKFLTSQEYSLFGFGDAALSEIIGNLFPDKFCCFNQRDKVAFENILGIKPSYTRGDKFVDKFIKFHKSLEDNKVVEKYLSIVGKQTELPIYYEIDQFFSFLYERYSKTDFTGGELGNAPEYWTISAGNNGQMWQQFYDEKIIAIGWDVLGDLSQYKNKREISDKLKELYETTKNPNNDVLANLMFSRGMKIGDYVFAKKGLNTILGYGKITSDYMFDPLRETYKSIRSVEWLKIGEWNCNDDRVASKTLTNITEYKEFVAKLLELIESGPTKTGKKPVTEEVTDTPTEYTIDQLLKEVFMTPEKVEEIIETLDYKKNIILQGPPGVGKTFIAKRLAYLHNGYKDNSRVAMVQFHQSYSYEDFIRGYKPNENGNFKLKNGIFFDFCKKAINDSEHNYYMIIDEINRGNLSKIFGELMMLIETDKRGKDYAISLTYSEGEEMFYIPENLYLIGTMNTADRSLALVDYALRRRFSFIELEPAFQSEAFKTFLISKGISQGFIDKIIESISDINREIENDKINLGKGYKIGHSYFCPTVDKVDDEEKWFNRIIKLEIEPLLKEYWFEDDDKVSDLIARLR